MFPLSPRSAIAEAVQVLFPSPCVVCGSAAGPVCAACVPKPQLQHRTVSSLLCVSGTTWRDETASIMLALKEQGITSVARALAPLLRAALVEVRGAGSATLVPIPTRRAADRSRGFRPVEVLLRASGVGFVRALRVRGRVRDQRELSRAQRHENAQSAFALRRGVSITQSVILVDDVITTGATLTAAAQTLVSHGISVIGAVTVLSTPKRQEKEFHRTISEIDRDT